MPTAWRHGLSRSRLHALSISVQAMLRQLRQGTAHMVMCRGELSCASIPCRHEGTSMRRGSPRMQPHTPARTPRRSQPGARAWPGVCTGSLVGSRGFAHQGRSEVCGAQSGCAPARVTSGCAAPAVTRTSRMCTSRHSAEGRARARHAENCSWLLPLRCFCVQLLVQLLGSTPRPLSMTTFHAPEFFQRSPYGSIRAPQTRRHALQVTHGRIRAPCSTL